MERQGLIEVPPSTRRLATSSQLLTQKEKMTLSNAMIEKDLTVQDSTRPFQPPTCLSNQVRAGGVKNTSFSQAVRSYYCSKLRFIHFQLTDNLLRRLLVGLFICAYRSGLTQLGQISNGYKSITISY